MRDINKSRCNSFMKIDLSAHDDTCNSQNLTNMHIYKEFKKEVDKMNKKINMLSPLGYYKTKLILKAPIQNNSLFSPKDITD